MTVEERLAIQDLYDEYVAALDEDRLEDWPGLFTEKCLYLVIPRDNRERGLPLGTTLCESRDMLHDRVQALRSTSMYAPRYVRHLATNLRVRPADDEPDAWSVGAQFLVLETRVDRATEILAAGAYDDRVVRDEGRLRFREKRAIYDSIVVPNSLVHPL